jgi:hypothetical protein
MANIEALPAAAAAEAEATTPTASPFKAVEDGFNFVGRASITVVRSPIDLFNATGKATSDLVANISGSAAQTKKEEKAATALQAATRGLAGRTAAKEMKVETNVSTSGQVKAAASGIDFALKRQQTADLAPVRARCPPAPSSRSNARRHVSWPARAPAARSLSWIFPVLPQLAQPSSGSMQAMKLLAVLVPLAAIGLAIWWQLTQPEPEPEPEVRKDNFFDLFKR